jgi:hypothetical protein
MYFAWVQGRAPKSEEEIVKYVSPDAPEWDDVRTGKYVVVWRALQPRINECAVLVYEREAGKDGKRYVLMTDREIVLMTDAELREALRR